MRKKKSCTALSKAIFIARVWNKISKNYFKTVASILNHKTKIKLKKKKEKKKERKQKQTQTFESYLLRRRELLGHDCVLHQLICPAIETYKQTTQKIHLR